MVPWDFRLPYGCPTPLDPWLVVGVEADILPTPQPPVVGLVGMLGIGAWVGMMGRKG